MPTRRRACARARRRCWPCCRLSQRAEAILTERSTMRRPQRLIAAAVLIVFSAVLAGCSSGFGSGWDPTDLLDWLDTKKKLPGERKPVFPEGVPGMEQGVPKELYKGAQQDDPNAQALAAPPLPEEPKKKQAKSKSKAPASADAT